MAARNGRGIFTREIRKLQDKWAKQTASVLIEKQDGDSYVPKHERIRESCPKCGKRHTASEHRFHGEVSHIRTHGETGGGSTVERSKAHASLGRITPKELASMEKQAKAMAKAEAKEKATTLKAAYQAQAENTSRGLAAMAAARRVRGSR